MDSLAPTAAHIDAEKTDALARRYGDALPTAGPWNETIASLLDHRSVRGFLSDPVPDGTLETLIAAAQSATSSNMQFWSAIAVSDPAKRKVLAEIAGDQKHIEQCPLYICWVADLSRNQRLGEALKADLESMPWLETFMVACIDAALAAQNAGLANAQAVSLVGRGRRIASGNTRPRNASRPGAAGVAPENSSTTPLTPAGLNTTFTVLS